MSVMPSFATLGAQASLPPQTADMETHSPMPPPFSPITPVLKHSELAEQQDGRDGMQHGAQEQVDGTQQSAQAQNNGQHSAREQNDIRRPGIGGQENAQQDGAFAPREPVPISESTNPDAIALRSALSILQLQRLRSLRDLETLQDQRRQALAQPDVFAQQLAQGTIRSNATDGVSERLWNNDVTTTSNEKHAQTSTTHQENADAAQLQLGPIPAPQNVVRCPPINWDQYHVVGEVLDRLHHAQQRQPTSSSNPAVATTAAPAMATAGLVHSVAAPYDPWTDHLAPSKGSG